VRAKAHESQRARIVMVAVAAERVETPGGVFEETRVKRQSRALFGLFIYLCFIWQNNVCAFPAMKRALPTTEQRARKTTRHRREFVERDTTETPHPLTFSRDNEVSPCSRRSMGGGGKAKTKHALPHYFPGVHARV
jgi:hypothetical protein